MTTAFLLSPPTTAPHLRPLAFSGKSASLPEITGASTSSLPSIVGSARPLMMIKPIGQTGALEVSDAPTAHADLPATMLDLLGTALRSGRSADA